ncbi:AsmA-like C-terminal region-containing protein [Aeromonas simiae]|uniref:Membrane assembly protein AsmA n=1 Tax=Aeromonas simiae TaxID=218936 RepID=A0A5J6WRA5_9GAMM|nr:AsmA-like C-terminal region-containing protein [Aeromonas simiae]QFI53360.1 membrane assembly protein AsmA [Aeromonas simiae]
MNSWLRALLYTLAFLLLLVWVALGLFDADRAKEPLARWLSAQSGVPVSIGKLMFNPLHPYTLLAEQVQVGESLTLEKLYVEVESVDWLERDVRLAHLDLIRPRVTLPLPQGLPSLPIQRLSVADGRIDRLSLTGPLGKVMGLSAGIRDWQLIDPVRPPQANLTLNINALETPWLTLSRLSLNGRLEGQKLSVERLVANAFDGQVETDMVLDWGERSLQLDRFKGTGMNIELGDIQRLEFPLRQVTLSHGELAQVSLNALSQELAFNDINVSLGGIAWHQGQAPTGFVHGRLGEIGRGLFQLEGIDTDLAMYPDRIDAELKGSAYDGHFNLELSLAPARSEWTVKDLSLSGMELSLPEGWWQSWQGWQPARLDVRRVALDKMRVLSFDDAIPLSLMNWQLYLNDVSLKGREVAPLIGRARLESHWEELVWDGLSSRKGELLLELSPEQWQLRNLESRLPDDGQLTLSGSWGVVAGQAGAITLAASGLDLAQWGKILHAPVSLVGKGDLTATLGTPDSSRWRETLTGPFALTLTEPFWDGIKIDPLLDAWFAAARPPSLDAGDLWQAMQGGDTPFYRLALKGEAKEGMLTLEGAAASTITHLIAARGGVNLVKEEWALDLGVLDSKGCSELTGLWRGPLSAPSLDWRFPSEGSECDWQVLDVGYPAQGRTSRLRQTPAP